MRKCYFLFFIFLSFFHGLSGQEEEINLSQRPKSNAGPTHVQISVYVIDIENIDNLKQNFTADFMLFVQWKDERLAGKARMMDLEDIWWPNMTILNGRNLNELLPKRVEVNPEGGILYRQRFYGHLAAPLDLKSFPFDEQELPVSIIALGQRPSTVELEFLHDASGSVERFSNSDWNIEEGVGSTGIFSAYSSSESHTEYQLPIAYFNFHAKRHIFYYIWKVIVPLLVIVMMSWAVFYFDPVEQVAPQIGLAATSILTLIAFLFSLGKILPPIAYLTKIDFFVYSSLSLVFLAFAEAVYTIKLGTIGKVKQAKRIDRRARWVFPLLFGLILIGFIFF